MNDSELNEVVARKLGWEKDHDGWTAKGKPWFPNVPAYSTDIAAAWEIVEKVKHHRFALRFDTNMYDPLAEPKWICTIFQMPHHGVEATADIAPRAICLAFLKLP